MALARVLSRGGSEGVGVTLGEQSLLTEGAGAGWQSRKQDPSESPFSPVSSLPQSPPCESPAPAVTFQSLASFPR